MLFYVVRMQCIFAMAIPLVIGGSIMKSGKGDCDVEYEAFQWVRARTPLERRMVSRSPDICCVSVRVFAHDIGA